MRRASPVAAVAALLILCASAGCNGTETAQTQDEGPVFATQRAPESCDVAQAALRWQPRVGEFASTRLLWNDLPRAAAELEIPFGVVAVREDGVAVHLPEIPLRERYLGLWLASGHLRVVDRQLVLDACAAELVSS